MPRNHDAPPSPDRRAVLAGGLALAATGLAPPPARATTAPHTFKHGDVDVSVLSDGHLDLPRNVLFQGGTREEIDAAYAAAGQTGERVRSPLNVTLIRRGSENILVDVGSGARFMDSAGKLGEALEKAGIDAAKVTTVVYTHGHPDHLWGTLDEFDDLRFPNARHVMSEAEHAYWTSADVYKTLPEDRHAFAAGAQRQLKPLAGKITLIKPGAEIAPGIQAIDTAGHTPGHISLEIASPSGPLVVLGDALTHPIISFAHPDWQFAGDHERDRAAATRRRLLDRLTADKATIIGYHIPFPGVGRVEKKGAVWRFVG